MSTNTFKASAGQDTRFEGRLAMWNAERGFGAIQPVQGGQELFVHVSAFPRDGAPPSPDEMLSFEVVSDGEGRKRAVNVQRLARSRREDVLRVLGPAVGSRSAMTLRRRREERRRLRIIAIAGLTVAVSLLGWSHFKSRQMQEGAQTLVAQGGAPR